MKECACGVSGKPAALRVEKRESEDFECAAINDSVVRFRYEWVGSNEEHT